MTSTSIYTSAIPVVQSKTCSKCDTIKPFLSFSKNKRAIDKHTSKCKECDKEYYNFNKEHAKEYRQVNKEYYKEYHKEYARENKGACSARTAKYKAAKLQATPKWTEFDLIDQLYIDCALITASTGVKHHVDHKVPLQSKIVCGLHCIANLRIISATENLSKRNYHWIDMP